jgi:hypothetical protein
VHLLEKSVLNMIWLLPPVFDWPILMIGPGGLLLVVPTIFNPCFGCKKLNNKTWMWEILCRVTYWAPVGML